MHVSRSANFLSSYLPTIGFAAEADTAVRMTHFTGYEVDIEKIKLEDPKDRVLGCIVGTSDLIAQMADRQYIEKCRDFLYREFVWGGIARETQPDGREIVRYTSATDLVIKTPGFYQYVARPRIEKRLEGAKDRLLGCIVGTSDLIAQMADRQYIEKCRDFLYWEFVWAGIARETQPDGKEIVRYASATDLVIKTPGFYQYLARPRIEKRLDGVDRYAAAHLDGPNLYQEEIARNMRFLHDTIESGEFTRLRRLTHSMSRPVPSRPRDAHE